MQNYIVHLDNGVSYVISDADHKKLTIPKNFPVQVEAISPDGSTKKILIYTLHISGIEPQ